MNDVFACPLSMFLRSPHLRADVHAAIYLDLVRVLVIQPRQAVSTRVSLISTVVRADNVSNSTSVVSYLST